MARRRTKTQALIAAKSAPKSDSGNDTLLESARRSLRRGDSRRALLLLERACHENDEARLWTLYGVHCQRMGKLADAERALRHALWMRERARDDARARVTRRLLAELERSAA